MESLHAKQIEHLVTEIFRRLAVRLGGDGQRGKVMTVLTGATVGFPLAVEQLRWCSLRGFCQVLAFSSSAEAIYGETVRQQLQGFPNIRALTPDKWLVELTEAEAVLVPMLSLNTASKVALLLADSLPANLILHGISLGKPIIAATNGCDPEGLHWARRAGAKEVTPAFRQACLQRLQTLAEYGCLLTDVGALGQTLLQATAAPGTQRPQPTAVVPTHSTPVRVDGRLVSTGHIRQAHRQGADIVLPPDGVVTPLAREMAASLGVKLQYQPSR